MSVYQGAASKNRAVLKTIKKKIENRRKIHIACIWLVYELFCLIKKDE